jgi:hypothetical protein
LANRRDQAEQKVLFEGTPEEVRAAMRRYTRRSMVWGTGAIIGSWLGIRWIAQAPQEQGIPKSLRAMLRNNESIFSRIFSSNSRTDDHPGLKGEERTNGDIGLSQDLDLDSWTLSVMKSGGQPLQIGLEELKQLPRVDMVTELRCIEGWSLIVHWTGVRFADFVEKHAPSAKGSQYVSLETPDGEYYVGLDMASALHPQTLLCFEMNGKPLTPEHGAPLRLVIPVKYGVKNLKRIGTVVFTDERPKDYWAELGYDWYAAL